MDNDTSVVHFTIQNSKVHFVPAAILAKYKNLKYLALSKVALSDITETSFANCGLVRELHLEYNELTILRNGIFQQCSNLVSLYLNNNKISTIRKDAFAGLKKLGQLYFYGNLYATFPTETFSVIPTLSYLAIGSSNLSAIHPKTFIKNQLSTLTIYDSKLTSIHRDLLKGQVKMTFLNIFKSLIANFELGTLQHLVSMIQVRITSSRFTTIDASMFAGLKKLTFIDIGSNQIESVHPDAFIDNVNLEYFYFSQNRFRILNGTMLRNNSKIQYIAFASNWINAIERNFFDSFGRSLRFVHAYGNWCVDKRMEEFTNFTTQVQPYFQTCYKNYDKLFPSASV